MPVAERDVITDVFDNEIITTLIEEIDTITNTKQYVLEKYGQKIFNNQVDIFERITNPNNHYIFIDMARGGGKSYAVGLSILEVCLTVPELMVAVFAPKLPQTTKIMSEVQKIARKIPEISDQIDWKRSSTYKTTFKNGSIIEGVSAHEQTLSEGGHFHIIVIDEAHMVSDFSMNAKIRQMLGSHRYRQLIKLGVSKYKNHFYKSSKRKEYKKCMADWTECGKLLASGVFEYEGRKYPQYIVELMPNELKREYFPDRPDLITGPSEMSVVEFKMQYMLLWLDDLALFLNEKNQIKLEGTHTSLASPIDGATYVFGLDTASGTLKEDSTDLEWTALSIWQVNSDGSKHKVACYEWQGSSMEQYTYILEKLRYWRVSYGIVEYSNIGITFVEQLQVDKIPCEGVMPQMTEKKSHKPYKIAAYDNFLTGLEDGKIKYPQLYEYKDDKENKERIPIKPLVDKLMLKHFNEWCILERYQKGSAMKIHHPDGEQDDGCDSDVYACFAVKRIPARAQTRFAMRGSGTASTYHGRGGR